MTLFVWGIMKECSLGLNGQHSRRGKPLFPGNTVQLVFLNSKLIIQLRVRELGLKARNRTET